MKQAFYAGMSWTDLPLLALLLFVGVFVAVVLRTWVLKKPTDFAAVERLPFEDGAKR